MNLALPELAAPLRLRLAKPMTDDEFLRFSAENSPLQIERDASGELLIMSPTWSETSHKNSDLTYQLEKWSRETNSGIVFDSNGGFTLPDSSVRSADAAWISWDRWNALSNESRQGFAHVCPQFLVELRSASDQLPDLQAKLRMWIANGAELAWLIDPVRKTVEIYRPGVEPEVQEGHTAVYGEGAVGGFVLELARIWG